jgi:hypothetical protein
MPQLTEFPFLPSGDPQKAVAALIEVVRAMPENGEPFKVLRSRLRDRDLWDRDRVGGLRRFLRLEGGSFCKPSPLVSKLAEGSPADAADVLAERLWEANPILFKTVFDRLADRVSPPGELYSYLDSFAYRGTPVPRREILSWVQLAQGLDILARIGIALGLGDRAEMFADRVKKLDIEEYLEEDQDEPSLDDTGADDDEAAGDAVPQAVGQVSTAAAPAPVRSDARSAAVRRAAEGRPSPLGQHPVVPVASLVARGTFDDELLADTTARLESWWAGGDAGGAAASPGDFGIDSERWMEGSEEALYRLAIAAAFAFRLDGDGDAVRASYQALEQARVFDDLYYGTAPDVLPAGVDSRALMLASLVARRCAEAPDLAANLEKQGSAAEAFAVLESALGRGLFRMELFWLMRALRDIGAVRWDDLDAYTALPTRIVRDTLFRLGYLDSPYAADLEALSAAASAACRAAGSATPADEVLAAFALAAGCDFGCTRRRDCDFACRERLE